MKTKHKLKLLKELRIKISSTIAISNKVPNVSSEYNRILDELIAESKEPTQKPEIEAKPEPITETFEVGEVVEILEPNPYKLDVGTQLKIIRHSSRYYTCELNNSDLLKQDYFLLPSEIKKIPIQKDNPKEFKVGDKVRVIDTSNHSFILGKEVTVIKEPSIFLWYIDCIDSCGFVQSLCTNQIEHI